MVRGVLPASRSGRDSARVVDGEIAGGGEHDAAGRLAKGAHQGRQTGDVAHRHPAAARPLQSVIRPDQGRTRRRVQVCQRLDLSRADAANRGDLLRTVQAHALAQRFESQRMAADVIVVDEIVANQHVHQSESKGGIGPRQQSDLRVAFFRRERTIRIDRNEPRAAPLGLLRPCPEMHARGDGVAAPEDDELRLLGELHIDAHARAQGDLVPCRAGRCADRAIQQTGAEPVEESLRHGFSLHQPHRSGVAVRQDLLRVVRSQHGQVLRDRCDRLLPADSLEAPLPFVADAAQRMQQPVGVVGSFGVARDLGAEHAGGRAVFGRSGHLERNAVLDVHLERARIRAIVRAGAFDDRYGRRYGRRLDHTPGRGFRRPPHHAA